jgi:hypothetical protein
MNESAASLSSSSGAGPSPSSTGDAEVARMRARFADLRKAQRAARLRVLALAAIVVIMFAVFAHVTVRRVQDNFEQRAVQQAVAERLPEVLPLAGEQVRVATLNALPTYRKLAAERFEQVRPALAARARARLEKVPDETGHLLGEALHTAFDSALKRIEPDVKRTFPSLTDAQKRDLLNVYFHDAIEARNKELASYIEKLYTNELLTMHAALDKFELPRDDAATHDTTAAPTDDKAQRDLLHTMLMLADYELLNADTELAADAATTAGSKRRAAATTQTAAATPAPAQ